MTPTDIFICIICCWLIAALAEARRKNKAQKEHIKILQDQNKLLSNYFNQTTTDVTPFGGGRVHQEKSLHDQLKEAEEKGEYERCAQLRDKIKKL